MTPNEKQMDRPTPSSARLRAGLVGKRSRSEAGWATATLDLALQRAVAIPNVGGPLLMIVVLCGAPPSNLRAVTMIALVATAGVAVLAIVLSRLAPGWTFLANSIVTTATWILAPALDSAVTFANCWIVNLTAISAALVLRGSGAILVPAAVGILGGVTIGVAHPDWDPLVPRAMVVTQIVIGIVVWFAMRHLRNFTAAVDEDTRIAERNRRAVAVAAAASQAAAESSRTLHDTVVNTLGAIANGGRVIEQRALVRARCARDVTTVESLLAERDSMLDNYARLTFLDGVTTLGRSVGLDIVVSPTGDGRSRGWEHAIPPAILDALRGAVHEVLLNTAKHSGAESATVDVQESPRDVTITVYDNGSGFDTAGRPGFGIAESVMARCRQHGIDVGIDSAPSQGTSVAFHYSFDPTQRADDRDAAAHVATTRQRACWAWAAGVVSVGIAIEFANRFLLISATWAMLALVAMTSVLAWSVSRSRAGLPSVVQSVLVLSAPAAFVLSLAGIDFGHTDPTTWQLLGATVPPVILRYFGSTWAFVSAIVALEVIGLGVGVSMWLSGSPYSPTVFVGALIALPPIAGFAYFHSAIEQIGARVVSDERAAQEDERRLEVRRASEVVRSRWQVAGLQSSVDLLRQIVAGEIDPADPDVGGACSREERYLRQLLMLSPDLVHLGYWLTRASARARERRVELTIRTGDLDAPDDRTARYLGELLLAELESAPAGSGMTVGVFPFPGGACMAIVGDAGATTSSAPSAPPHIAATKETYGEQYLIEVNWASPTR